MSIENVVKYKTFEKIIYSLLLEDNKYHFIERGFRNSKIFDYTFMNGVNLNSFEKDLYIDKSTAIIIKFTISHPYIKLMIEKAINEKYDNLIIFTLKKFKKEKLEEVSNLFSKKINIIIFDENKLININEIKELSRNLDNYLVENESIIDYFDEIKGKKELKISFALGAGCSIDANISNWEKLSNSLGYEMLYSLLDKKESSYLRMSVAKTMSKGIFNNYDKSSALDAIQSLYESEMLTKNYYLLLKKVLYMSYNSPFDAKTELMNVICNLINKYKIEEIITYNFDSVLEQCLKDDYKSKANEISKSTTVIDFCSIYHVHGYIPYDYDGKNEINNFVFTDKEYFENALNDNNFTNVKQKYLFDNYNVIFIGVSFTDSNLKQILRNRMLNGNKSKQLYAFYKLPKFDVMGREKIIVETKYKLLQQSYFDTLGVKIIWVREYSEIVTKLKSLLN